MDKLLLRPIEAAEAIGVGRSKVYELLAKGALPSVRIGSSIRIPVEGLKAWIAEQLPEFTGDRPPRGTDERRAARLPSER